MGTESVSGNLILRKQPVLYFKHSQHISFLVLQSIEKKERAKDDENKERKQKGADKGGKGRGTKKIKDECLPTPNARRIEPRIDAAMRQKVAAVARAKSKAQVLLITPCLCTGSHEVSM